MDGGDGVPPASPSLNLAEYDGYDGEEWDSIPDWEYSYCKKDLPEQTYKMVFCSGRVYLFII